MKKGKLNIYVYAHWQGMLAPQLMGVLSALYAKGKKAFSFEYDKEWIKSKEQLVIDPDIQFYTGLQYPNKKENFGVFLDSMPDTWGKTLMKRNAMQQAKEQGKKVKTLYEIDYLLGVYDDCRMGALRFKTAIDGKFLDSNNLTPTPPWSSIGELQEAAKQFESDDESELVQKCLAVLIT